MRITQVFAVLLAFLCVAYQVSAYIVLELLPPVQSNSNVYKPSEMSYLGKVIESLLSGSGGNVLAVVNFLLAILSLLGYHGRSQMAASSDSLAKYLHQPYSKPHYDPIPIQFTVPIEIVDEGVPVDVGVPFEPYASQWGYPMGWGLDNSEVLTGSSASAGQNVLAGGSTSVDGGTFTNKNENTRSRASSSVGFGMIGGDGGDIYNSVQNGIAYNGGGIVNFLSKVQGVNNQGVMSEDEFWRQAKVVYTPPSADVSYAYNP